MKTAYAMAFLVLAAVALLVAVAGWDLLGAVRFGFGYAAISLALLSVAYFGAGPRLFLKRESGRSSVRGWVLFLPYFVLNAIAFHAYRLLSREPAYAQAAANLYFGRRLSAHEAKQADPLRWVAVLDLAAEFGEAQPMRALPGYRSLPVLDATAPTEQQLRSAVEWLVERAKEGPVYVHCALGHGRTACVVAAYLFTIGEIVRVADGLRLLRSLRPGVRLNRDQSGALRRYEVRQGAERE